MRSNYQYLWQYSLPSLSKLSLYFFSQLSFYHLLTFILQSFVWFFYLHLILIYILRIYHIIVTFKVCYWSSFLNFFIYIKFMFRLFVVWNVSSCLYDFSISGLLVAQYIQINVNAIFFNYTLQVFIKQIINWVIHFINRNNNLDLHFYYNFLTKKSQIYFDKKNKSNGFK